MSITEQVVLFAVLLVTGASKNFYQAISNGDLNKNEVDMNEKEDLTQQIPTHSGNSEIGESADYSFVEKNTSENDYDEVDGNNICGFRKKKGVKGPTKYVPPLENENMELFRTSKVSDASPLQGTTSCSEPPPDQSLQNPTSFLPVQRDRGGRHSSRTGGGAKEDMSGETQENQDHDDSGKRTTGKMHKEIDTPAKTEHPMSVQPTRSSGKAGCGGAACGGEGSEKAEQQQGGMEEKAVKFQVTKTGSLGSAATTDGGTTAESFTGAPDISRRSLQELKNLLSEGPLPDYGPNYRGKAGGAFSQKSLKPRDKTADKQGRSFETFRPHFGEENRKYHSFHKEGVGQRSKPLLVLSSAGSDQHQPAGSDMDQLILRLPASSTHAEGTAPEIQFDSSAGQAGKEI
ncbi:lengsin [Limosa lapponica baueri]|uniref:Lengsin n=1 Tax=Limosa lapponica baueri TaxID=1758121 RepID=A0A2I0T980_LIMLA|nr:lengsin [Limosa lapponica baueri]